MTESFQVVIVDDHPLFREGVASTLCAEPDIEVVGQGETAEDAFRLAVELLPDILLLDISIPGGGLNIAPKIATACPVTKIVMLTASAEEDDVISALQAGARGYIVKGVSARELVHILRTIEAGEPYVTPALAASLLTFVRSGGQSGDTPLQDLTERERQILQFVAAGQTNREIAEQLYLSEKTVKHYMTNIIQKLHVRNRVEAALVAHKLQAVDRRLVK